MRYVIPEHILKWLEYDEKNFKMVLKKDTPNDIKEEYEKLENERIDFKYL